MECMNFDGADLYCLLSATRYEDLSQRKKRVCFRYYEHMKECRDCYEDFGHVLEDMLRESQDGAIVCFWENISALDAELFRHHGVSSSFIKLK